MPAVVQILLAILYLGILVAVANLIAQRVYPTLLSSSWGRRYGYNVLTGAIVMALVALHLPLLFLLEGMGVRL